MKRNSISIICIRSRRLFFACFLLLSFCGYSQDYLNDIQKIREHYKSGDIAFHIKYCFYPYDSVHKAIDSMKADCYMNGGDYYYKITSGGGTYEYYKNSKYYFVIDHANKAVAVKKTSDARSQAWDINTIDSLMHSPSVKITYKEAGNNRGEYYIQTDNPSWSSYRLLFNKTTYSVEEMDMYSQKKGKMYGEEYNRPVIGIYYTDYSYGHFSSAIFSGNGVFSDTQNSIVLSNAYEKYKLLDYVYPSKQKNRE